MVPRSNGDTQNRFSSDIEARMSTARALKLGETEVTRIGLGTNRLTNTRRNISFLREAVGAGLNHLDTAYTYTGGESETTIGAALSPFPHVLVVARRRAL